MIQVISGYTMPKSRRRKSIGVRAACLALLAVSLPAAAQLAFVNAPSPAVGDSPRSVAVGDFNGDGLSDLVVANEWSGSLSVLLGNGNGTFRAQVAYAVGGPVTSIPFAVAVADFNGDRRTDLAVANYSNGTVSVLAGNANGTFQPQVSYSAGISLSPAPIALTVADFNGDRAPDVAAANFDDFNAAVFLGNGDGTLRPRMNFVTGTASIGIAAGDFNADGKPDVAVVNAADANVSVLLGNGDGTFRPQVVYATGRQPRSVASADFNGDGRADLAVANRDDNNVSVLLANADGTFRAQITYASGTAPYSVAVGDLNGDGKSDLAVADSQTNSVSVLAGRGDGSFQNRTAFPTGVSPHAVAVGDFDSDGKPDLALANFTCERCQGSVSVLLNRTAFVNDEVTGTWYNTATPGQGFTFEVFPNRGGPGHGVLAGEWFTFAAGAPGDAGSQRWYSLQADFSNVQGAAAFVLYQNVGGNFDAPPPTSASVVGDGLISFSSCSEGRIDYRFTVGGGLAGSIPITRLTPSTLCPTAGTGGTTYPDPGLSGLWYNPATAGQGFFFDVNPNTPKFFGAWYTYAPNGADTGGPGSQRWYTLQLDNFAPATRTFQDVAIFQTTGGSFDRPPTGSLVSPRVGTATVQFDSCTGATVTYSFSDGSSAGLAGTIALSRIGPPPASCR
jgi:hypothetical protein